jgi:hypothetical protein
LVLPLGLAFGPTDGEECPDRLLAGGVVCSDVQELASGARLPTAELVNEGLASGPERNTLTMSASTTSGRELHCLENRRM